MMLSILRRKLFIKELTKILNEIEIDEKSSIDNSETTEIVSEELNEEESVLN